MNTKVKPVRTIAWDEEGLVILDQRRLPDEEAYLRLDDVDAVIDAIRDMAVRGAPAIGITAAYGVAVAARNHVSAGTSDRAVGLRRDIERLGAARPTAVNLRWALARMSAILERAPDDLVDALIKEARVIHNEEIEANQKMALLGADLIEPGSCVYTHCNTGALATGGSGTALAVIRQAWHENRLGKIFAGETRPWLQGARLTAWELAREQIPVTVAPDSAAAFLMQRGQIQWVILGADRVAANGDVANKIGTYSLAVAARHHGVRFMVVAPVSTVDFSTASGADIELEQRPAAEIWRAAASTPAPACVDVTNPAFDVTPAELIDVFVAEKGVVEKPDRNRMQMLKTNDEVLRRKRPV